MNLGSAYIPPDILPPRNHPDYMRIYLRERKKVDPKFLEQVRRTNREAAKRFRERKRNAP